MKTIFLKVVSSDNIPTLVICSGQTQVNANGVEEKLPTTVSCVTRNPNTVLLEGEYYATNSVHSKPQGWYVVGTEFYKVADELGLILTEFDDKKHQEYAEAYRLFSQGVPVSTDFGNSNVSQKAKQPTVLEKLMNTASFAPPTIEDDGWYVDKDLWYYLLRNYKKRKNTLLIGSSGAGKTELLQFMIGKVNSGIKNASKKLNIDIFDMAVSNPNKTFCGNLRAENGSTHFQLARFATAIQEKGLIVMDELSRATPTANNIFLPLLDGRRTLYIEDAIIEDDRMIKAHEDCVFWATANIGAEFIGTSTLDHALLNRFNQVAVKYPPEDKESLLIQKRFGVSKRDADALVRVVSTIRTNPDLSKDISTRQLFEVAELVADGYTPVNAFKWSVLQQFEGNDADGGEQSTVLSIIQSL